jgi:deoxyribodipyrimidine photo-lyase
MIDIERIHPDDRGQAPQSAGPVLYWINRERRARDNWALLHAQHVALERHAPLHVVFCLVPSFLGATLRQYDFMLRGLQELERDLLALNISFSVILDAPVNALPRIAEKASIVITDHEPLRIKKQWVHAVKEAVRVPVVRVDAHNIVPVWTASMKREFGAYTLRPKINKLLPRFLTEFPAMVRHPYGEATSSVQWDAVWAALKVDTTVSPVTRIVPGERAAHAALQEFVGRLSTYADQRNDPTKQAQSGLSPWLHFGHLAPQRAALEAKDDAFLEELIVRRELADNFCHYEERYDDVAAFPDWAQRTLDEHRDDPREHVYSYEQWDAAATHDELWNAAQRQVQRTGTMHGYMRMYWAKKLLEWSRSPEEALAIGIALNDRYQLDGRDPNGYCGLAWSIGGVHDRAWFERPVYGKIRYMNAAGCARKFDVKRYIAAHAPDTPADLFSDLPVHGGPRG